MAVLPLIIMARRVFELITGESQSGQGILGILGVYLVLLIPAAIMAALITAIRMMRQNPLVTSYAAVGIQIWARYRDESMDVPPATGYATLDYDELADVVVIGTAVVIRPKAGQAFALPRELVPDEALAALRSGFRPAPRASGAAVDVHPDNDDAEPAPVSRRRRAIIAVCAVGAAVAVFATIGLTTPGDHTPGTSTRRAVDTTIAVELQPSGTLAIDSVAKLLYVANSPASDSNPGSVSVIDLGSNTVKVTINLTSNPNFIAVDPGTRTVYVTSSSGTSSRDGRVTVIDAVTNSITASIPTKQDSRVIVVDPISHTVLVNNLSGSFDVNDPRSDPAESSVSVIPRGSASVSATVPSGINSMGIAVAPDLRTAFVSSRDGTVKVIDLATNIQTGSIPVSIDAGTMMFDPGSNKVFAVDRKGMIAVIDPSMRKVIGSIDGLGQEIHAVAIDSGTHAMYLASMTDSRIKVVDTVSQAITGTLSAPSPQSLAVDPSTHTLYAYAAGQVSVIRR
ncbi:YncE family protein [Nocardia sp. NPDC056000]|uniref:YncE family protein n=1 Tax=Nocardia sp. NPDC056000 TaxID=3345674 RepID=UPI0035D6E3B3